MQRKAGWRGESYRHGLAARGIRTGYFARQKLGIDPATKIFLRYDPDQPLKFGPKQGKAQYAEVEERASKYGLPEMTFKEYFMPSVYEKFSLRGEDDVPIRVGQLVTVGGRTRVVKSVKFEGGVPKVVLEADVPMAKGVTFTPEGKEFIRQNPEALRELVREAEDLYMRTKDASLLQELQRIKALNEFGKLSDEDFSDRLRFILDSSSPDMLGEDTSSLVQKKSPTFYGQGEELVDLSQVKSVLDARGDPIYVGKGVMLDVEEKFRGPTGYESPALNPITGVPVKETARGEVTGFVETKGKPFITFEAMLPSKRVSSEAGEFIASPILGSKGIAETVRADDKYTIVGVESPEEIRTIALREEAEQRKAEQRRAMREAEKKAIANLQTENPEEMQEFLERGSKFNRYMARKDDGPMEYIQRETRRTHADPGWEKFRDGVKGELHLATSLDKEWLRYQRASGNGRPNLAGDRYERAQQRGTALFGRVVTMANVEPMLDHTKGENVREASFDVLFGRGAK